VQGSARATSELHALLDLPATAPRREWDATPEAKIGASAAPAWAWRVESEVKRELRPTWLKTAGLAVLGMGVVLIAGGIALTAQRTKSSSESIAPAPSQTIAPQSVAPSAAVALPPARRTVEGAVEDEHGAEASLGAEAGSAKAAASAIATSASKDTWVVQVGAFSSHERSLDLVERLMESGFPAFEVPSSLAAGGLLYFVRVGPFKTAGEADEARVELRQFEELESAFVRSVTTPAP
jgi:cell division septation protein DedD